ncbi:MAG: hypothetical protein JXA25_08130 [Anaerolineales bacterium]|nr:hypothetical protein [Anaerolineales bacterium]
MKRITGFEVVVLLPAVLLFSGILTCARAPRLISPENAAVGENYWLSSTETAAVSQTAAAELAFFQTATESARQTAVTGPTSTVTIEPGMQIEDRLAVDNGIFAFTGASLFEGDALFFGPEERCALDRPDYVQPVGCMAVCQACQTPTDEFSMGVDLMFASGVSEREFGIVLRFVDENGDGLLGDEDYLLAVGMNIFTNQIKVYLHEPGSGLPLEVVESKDGGFNLVGIYNRLEVLSEDSGRQIDVLINEARVFRLRGYSSDPGETYLDNWVDSGSVGLILLQRGVQVQYGNYSFGPISP